MKHLPYNTKKQRLVVYKAALRKCKELAKYDEYQGLCILLGELTGGWRYSPWTFWVECIEYFPELNWYECPNRYHTNNKQENIDERIDLLTKVIKRVMPKQVRAK